MQVTSPEMLANYIRDIRKIMKLNQTEVAKEVGLKQLTISDFENRPSGTKLATLFKILSALGLEIHIQQSGKDFISTNWKEEW